MDCRGLWVLICVLLVGACLADKEDSASLQRVKREGDHDDKAAAGVAAPTPAPAPPADEGDTDNTDDSGSPSSSTTSGGSPNTETNTPAGPPGNSDTNSPQTPASPSEELEEAESLLQTKNINIVVKEEPPWVFVKNGQATSGYIIDVLHLLRDRLGFKYTLYLADKYGTLLPNKTWTGMIGEVAKDGSLTSSDTGAYMAAGPITITSAREAVVDFIKPFKHTGLQLVMKKSYLKLDDGHTLNDSFDIIYPIHPTVWACTVLAMILVGLLLWVNNRFNPYEWTKRHELGRATDAEGETFTLPGSLWFTFTTFVWQGYERAPRSLAAKLMACFWFSFVIVILIAYTGGLVTQLFWSSTYHGKDLTQPPARDLEHVLMDESYTVGCVRNTSTWSYLKNTAGAEYDVIREKFLNDEDDSALVNDTEDGLERVRSEKYAFITESLTAKYYVNQRNPLKTGNDACDLTTVGPVIGQRGYGFALKKNVSPAERDLWNAVTLELVESGELEVLEHKWWVWEGECWNVTEMEKAVSLSTSALLAERPVRINIQMFWAPLLLLLLGVIFSVLIFFVEVLYYKYKGRYDSSNRPGGQQLKLDEDGNM